MTKLKSKVCPAVRYSIPSLVIIFELGLVLRDLRKLGREMVRDNGGGLVGVTSTEVSVEGTVSVVGAAVPDPDPDASPSVGKSNSGPRSRTTDESPEAGYRVTSRRTSGRVSISVY